MGEKADVACEVQILQLLHEGPLNCCGLLHDPVNHHQEDLRREQTTLANASSNGEGLRQFTFTDDLTTGVFVELLDNGDNFKTVKVLEMINVLSPVLSPVYQQIKTKRKTAMQCYLHLNIAAKNPHETIL